MTPYETEFKKARDKYMPLFQAPKIDLVRLANIICEDIATLSVRCHSLAETAIALHHLPKKVVE